MRKYITVFITLLLLFDYAAATTPRPVNVYLKNTKVTVPGMESIRFIAISGTDRVLNYTLYVTLPDIHQMCQIMQ